VRSTKSPSLARESANKNDGCHVEQKNWTTVRTLVGYHRYDTPAELLLLNKIWVLQSLLSNYFCPQQSLSTKPATARKSSRSTTPAATPQQRAQAHPNLPTTAKADLTRTYLDINPAALQRHIQARINELVTLTRHQGRTPAQSPTQAGISKRRDEPSSRGHPALRQRIAPRAY